MHSLSRYGMSRAPGLIITVLASVLSVHFAAAQSAHRIGKTELKELISNARSQADHEKIASHYRSEGERLLFEAKEHDEMAQVYARQPGPESVKHPLTYRTEAHCKYVAARYRESARKMQELASAHEDMAKRASK